MLSKSPHLPNIDLRKLKFFAAVARAGSFVAASRDLHVSQPAVSYQVIELERELGVKLLDRQARGVSLTPAGTHFLGLVEEMLANLHDMINSLDAFRTEVFGTVTFGLTPTCSRLLAHHLLSLCTPTNRLQLAFQQGLTDELQRQITAGTLDLALFYDPSPIAGQQIFPMFCEDVYLIGPPEVLARGNDDIRLADIADIPLVLDQRLNVLRRKIEKAAAQAGVKLNVVLETNDVTLKRSFMSNQQYCTLVHHGLFSDQIKEGQLNAKRVIDPIIERHLALVARPGMSTTVVDFFLSAIRSIVADRIAEGEVKWRL
jgi:LysR family nitrogen assimilation transcriptional regulator